MKSFCSVEQIEDPVGAIVLVPFRITRMCEDGGADLENVFVGDDGPEEGDTGWEAKSVELAGGALIVTPEELKALMLPIPLDTRTKIKPGP